MCPYGSLYCRSLCVLMNSNGSFWVSMGPYSSLRNLMDPYRSLCVFIGHYGFLLVIKGPYVS